MKTPLQHLVSGIGEIAVAGGAITVAACVSLTALMRFFDPSHWGLWMSPRIFMIGVIDDPNAAQEMLGAQIYPIALLVAFLGAMVAKEAWALAQDHWRHARRT